MKYEIVERIVRYRGFLRVVELVLRHERFAGGWTERFTRDLLERGPAVAIIAYDPDLDRLVMVEQFRIGALERAGGPWILELPAGIVDPGETSAEVARRELEEETGLEATELFRVGEYLVSPGGSTETFELFCARVDASSAGGLHGCADEHEDIRVHSLDRVGIVERVANGEALSAMTVVGIQWLELNRARVRERWARVG